MRSDIRTSDARSKCHAGWHTPVHTDDWNLHSNFPWTRLLCRYRDGPLPDIQIPPASLIAPLVSLIGNEKDGPVSQSIFCDALVSSGADRSAILFATLQDVLREASRQSNGPLVKTLLKVWVQR